MPHVVVTGASQGIGRAIALAFADLPSTHLALVARSAGKLDAVAEACRQRGAAAQPFPCDVTDAEAVAAMAESVRDAQGVPDVVVNNAGAFEPGLVADLSPASFRAQIDVNLTSAFYVTHAFLNPLLERGSGHLFFIGSVASIRAYPNGAAYCAAKHGLLGLARTLREETKTRGLRVTTLLPGATLTPSWAGTDLPEERFMPPEDIARAVVDAWRLSDRTVLEEVILRPQEGDL